jgi:group I intron endonuclease
MANDKIIIGIYKIINPNGKVYIGQSINIKKRFLNYKKFNCIKQPKLHRSFVKYGADKHCFSILEECLIEELNIKERFYQLLYNSTNRDGLNCILTNENDSNGMHCEETKAKMSASAKVKIFTKEHRENMSKARVGNKNAMFGKKQSEEAKLKMSLKKQNLSEESRKNYSISAKNRDKSFYEKLSIINKGKLPTNCKIVLNLETGIFYNSVTEASKTFSKGQGSQTLAPKLSGLRKNNTNFIYV